MQEYYKANQEGWDKRTELHLDSEFYDMASFEKGRNSLPQIDQQLLGDIKGKRVLHLQCHFGQDSLSMARMGAQVTGIDLSPKAIENAKKIARKLGLEAEFICCNVLEIDQHLEGEYDIVYTSYGTIGWLPELTKWGQLIKQHLKPDGRFVMAEFHPVVWMLDDGLENLTYSYFNQGVIQEEEQGSYGDREDSTMISSFTWNHSLSEVFGALKAAGLQITTFEELDYSPWNCFPKTVAVENGFQIEGLQGKMPMVFAIIAVQSQ